MTKKPKPVSAATRALLDEMTSDANKPSPDKLDKAREKLSELRDLEKEKQDLGVRLTKINEDMRIIKEKNLVELFDAAGIDALGLPPSGNLPAYEVELTEYFHASIPEDKKSEAWQWMKATKNEDLVKTEFKVAFGLTSAARAKKFEAGLKKLVKDQYEKKQSVPWNTLTAFVKAEFKAGRTMTKKVMAILGVTTGRVATVIKEKK